MSEENQTAETTQEEKKGLKAKTVSLIGKIVAVVVLLGGIALKSFGIAPNLETNDLIKIAFSIMGVFGTIDLNIALDKFVK